MPYMYSVLVGSPLAHVWLQSPYWCHIGAFVCSTLTRAYPHGFQVILMVASSRGSSGGTTVWRGIPNSIGLFSFSANHDAISESVSADSLQVSPASRSTLVVVSTSKQFLFVSRDTGREWDHYPLPSRHFDSADDLYLSYKNPRHMVLLTLDNDLYVSDSWGELWSHISGKVELAEL